MHRAELVDVQSSACTSGSALNLLRKLGPRARKNFAEKRDRVVPLNCKGGEHP